mgnify:CR=1 FL=1
MKISIIIPLYNKQNSLKRALDSILNQQNLLYFNYEIIVVNDCSKDNTWEILNTYKNDHPSMNIQLFQHEVNQGKGAALHTGIKKATGDVVVIQDADLEYDPNEFNILLKPIEDDVADVVFGSRFMGGKPHRILFFWHSIGNKFLTFLSNMFTNLNLTDMETCYKLFNTKMVQSLELREKRFGFEPEVTSKISKIQNIRIYEVGISYYGRTYAEGKKINWKDGVKAIYCIIRYNLFP